MESNSTPAPGIERQDPTMRTPYPQTQTGRPRAKEIQQRLALLGVVRGFLMEEFVGHYDLLEWPRDFLLG